LQLAYVILLPDDVHNFMRRMQAELYERYEARRTTLYLEPHITLKQPFDADEVDRHERYLDTLAKEVEPFELVMRGFGYFEAKRVVFVDVEQHERLGAIQRNILSNLGLPPAEHEGGEPLPYRFHATLATGLSAPDLSDARARFADTPEFRFPLARLGLFRRVKETWTLYKRSVVERASP
jgi:2'-5' RNA ligase